MAESKQLSPSGVPGNPLAEDISPDCGPCVSGDSAVDRATLLPSAAMVPVSAIQTSPPQSTAVVVSSVTAQAPPPPRVFTASDARKLASSVGGDSRHEALRQNLGRCFDEIRSAVANMSPRADVDLPTQEQAEAAALILESDLNFRTSILPAAPRQGYAPAPKAAAEGSSDWTLRVSGWDRPVHPKGTANEHQMQLRLVAGSPFAEEPRGGAAGLSSSEMRQRAEACRKLVVARWRKRLPELLRATHASAAGLEPYTVYDAMIHSAIRQGDWRNESLARLQEAVRLQVVAAIKEHLTSVVVNLQSAMNACLEGATVDTGNKLALPLFEALISDLQTKGGFAVTNVVHYRYQATVSWPLVSPAADDVASPSAESSLASPARGGRFPVARRPAGPARTLDAEDGEFHARRPNQRGFQRPGHPWVLDGSDDSGSDDDDSGAVYGGSVRRRPSNNNSSSRAFSAVSIPDTLERLLAAASMGPGGLAIQGAGAHHLSTSPWVVHQFSSGPPVAVRIETTARRGPVHRPAAAFSQADRRGQRWE